MDDRVEFGRCLIFWTILEHELYRSRLKTSVEFGLVQKKSRISRQQQNPSDSVRLAFREVIISNNFL